jgi:hypothetical protein
MTVMLPSSCEHGNHCRGEQAHGSLSSRGIGVILCWPSSGAGHLSGQETLVVVE